MGKQKDIVIFGTADFGRMMKYYIEQDDSRKVVAFTVDRAYMNSDLFCGLPVVAFEDLTQSYPPDAFDLLIAIGNSRMNDVRKKVFNAAKERGYHIASFIHSSCTIHSSDIGEGNIMLDKCLVYPYAKIGDGNLMWDHVVICHDCSVGNFNTFSSYADLCGYVHIGNNGFFGKHCVMRETVQIADYTLVGAMAFVTRDTNPYSVVVPVRSIVLENKVSTDLM